MTESYALQFGSAKALHHVDSIAAAKAKVNAYRNKRELAGSGGASRFPEIRLWDVTRNRVIGHASYNGRMWEGEPRTWTPATREIF